jgi:chemotaxis protein CheD
MITVGIGEYAITDIIDEHIITHALGSCVAIIVYCPYTKCTAMAHIVLPSQDRNNVRIVEREAYYAEDILPKMIDFFIRKPNCNKNRLKVMMVGGAIKKGKDVFNVGQRNVRMVKNILNSYGLNYEASETLGQFSRTVTIEVETGIITIKKQQMIL